MTFAIVGAKSKIITWSGPPGSTAQKSASSGRSAGQAVARRQARHLRTTCLTSHLMWARGTSSMFSTRPWSVTKVDGASTDHPMRHADAIIAPTGPVTNVQTLERQCLSRFSTM